MSIEDSGREGVPMVITDQISAEKLTQYFSHHSDLTYRKLEGLIVSDVDIYQSLLTGTLIRDSVFTRVKFNRSDLDGLRAERSTFIECDFSTCDIRSSAFTHCKFHSCDFNTSFIDDCEFQVSEFDNCSFQDSSLTGCRFQKSSLTSCRLSPGTFLHNKLYSSAISDTVLGDCSLLYVILRDSTLTRVSINAESVGAIFGLTREQLSQSDMIYLGNEEPIPPGSDVLHLITEEYRQRKWYMGELVLAVNFNLEPTAAAFQKYLARTYERFAEFGFAKGEELEFLGDLLQELAFLHRLPLLTALNILEWCTELELVIRQNNEDLPEKSWDALRTLASRVALLTNNLLDRLDQNLPDLKSGESDRSLCLKATFYEKPSLPFIEFLNSISVAANLDAHKSSLVRTGKGSYFEIVYTTLFSLYSLKIFLYLVNGCLIQLTEMRHRAKVLVSESTPKSYMDLALSPVQQTSPAILSMLGSLTEFTKVFPALKSPSLSGYLTSNLKSFEEVECAEPESDTGDAGVDKKSSTVNDLTGGQ